MNQKMRIGISTCLLGEPVRYNGGHKLDRFIVDTLGKYLEFVPVCPEVECGLPVPRETLRLVGDPENPRLVTTHTHIDHTDRMKRWGRKRLKELEKRSLIGYIFKSRSPSSGMKNVRVYDRNGIPNRRGSGIWARMFMDRFPLLPVEEDGRLHDDTIRENFIERLFALERWRDALADGKSRRNLVAFHAAHKLLLMSHSPSIARELGRLVGRVKEMPLGRAYRDYEKRFLEALALTATVKKHTNVLMHMAGYFKKLLSPEEKQELTETIDRYRRELVPLVVPLTLISHYVREYREPYLSSQAYLNPHPVELKLRNHV